MSTEQTTHGPQTEAKSRCELAKREYDAHIAAFEAARGRGDKKAAYSESAKASIRSARIHEAELDMAIAGETFEPWVKPQTSSTASRQTPLSQKDIEASLAKVAKVLADPSTPETVKVTADQRVTALLKAAEKRGYQVSDPR